MNPLVLPVNVVEGQATHLAGSEAVYRQQHQHRVVADLGGGVATVSVEEPLHLAPLGTLGQPLMRVQPRGLDRLSEPRPTPAAHGTMSKERAQGLHMKRDRRA